jgi:hypothetical protein
MNRLIGVLNDLYIVLWFGWEPNRRPVMNI